MDQEELYEYMDRFTAILLELGKIKSPTAQAVRFQRDISEFIQDIWENGHTQGFKEGERQKRSVIIKQLSKEN